jgi:hypothetical protein
MSAMKSGDKFIWQGKRQFEFIEKIGRQYYFRCPDFIDEWDPKGIVSLVAHHLKDLTRKKT